MSLSSEKTSVPTTRHLFRQISVSLKQSNSGHKKTNKIQSQKHMKPKSILTALAVALLAPGALFAQTTATTTPVGYVSLTIPAESDSTFTPALNQAPVLSTAATAVAGNTVSFTASGIQADAFVNQNPTFTKSYLLVTSGPLEGQRFPITANTTSSVTVASSTNLQSAGLLTGATFSVINNWTLQSVFPGGAGVGVSTDLYEPLGYVLVSDQASVGVNRANTGAFYYYVGDETFPAGWRDANDPEGPSYNDLPLDPTITYTIRTGTNAQTLTLTGQVPSTKLVSYLVDAEEANDQYVSNPFPVDMTLQASGLQSAIQESTDIYDPKDIVFVYDEEAEGVNKGASASYFYFAGDNDYTAGWRDSNNPEGDLVTDPVLKAGRCFTIRKQQATTPGNVVWTTPRPYSLNP